VTYSSRTANQDTTGVYFRTSSLSVTILSNQQKIGLYNYSVGNSGKSEYKGDEKLFYFCKV
jgi:hypothetical protein